MIVGELIQHTDGPPRANQSVSIHVRTNFPTQTEEDRAIIRKLIEDYMTDKRTIILAVMDARNNLANQEV
ncbi:dynamin [Penicillium digitatum]|uniref:Dynamin n=1 Tax=Penicillium digitatum TaxID=36651 RepID=A0A7T6XMI4_PENDI|nr:dynamin [Penicillium digitatum]